MANKKIKCDECGRVYSSHNMLIVKDTFLCYYCRNGWEPPRFKKS